jgi:tetratricopeptide (TPR) repeat protein
MLFAQNRGSLFFTEEIQNLAKTLQGSELSAAKRQELLIRQARLLQLTGNLEEAAKAWSEAAFADKERQNDTALLEEAFCFFALGELEKSETGAKTVILTTKDKAVQFRAKYLLAQIDAFRSDDLSSLIELSGDADYAPFKPAIYYTLWKFSGADRYKTRLLSEYPSSPEAFMLKEPASVMIFPSPLWVFFPGRNRITLETAGDSQAPAAVVRSPSAVQTGLFGREENAKAMTERLKSAGFNASITRRIANDGAAYWVVTVPAGSDINRTISQLKEKGFDSFPVF